jgi:predicted dehydrogenase
LKQVLIKKGVVVVEDVPAPSVEAGCVLVKVERSCVSPGTESAAAQSSGEPLYKRAIKNPALATRVVGMMLDEGIGRVMERVMGRLASGMETGYSAAGVIIGVGDGVAGFAIGDRVACAGTGYANHAEIINVPVNLAVKIPAGVDMGPASTVALGAIAMQGVRRATTSIGETVAVIGLGALGLLTAQMLRAAGCRVIGSDIDEARLEKASALGMNFGINPDAEDYPARVYALTGGVGADAVIITAASKSSDIVSEAMRACRRKGKVVLVGDVGLNLNRADMYEKELDFFISTSYGPGRYDKCYEREGQDYPLAYVRWTEGRNMEEYLRLLAEGKISVSGMSETYDIDNAPSAYSRLTAEENRPLFVILSYPPTAEAPIRKMSVHAAKPSAGKIRVAVIGASSFAESVHLPNMLRLRDSFSVRAIMSKKGSRAKALATRFGAELATTDIDEILADPEINLVLITTRHNLHAGLVLRALNAGKNVFVEKPLAITAEQLDDIEAFYAANPAGPLLMTGFNRSFSPPIQVITDAMRGRNTPMMLNYRMNAGYLPPDHWTRGPEGGGRNIGEACHIYDLFNLLSGATFTDMSAISINPSSPQWGMDDNFIATVKYSDGSVCSLTYTALGAKSHPKERMDIYCDGKVFSLDDYHSLTVDGIKHRGWKSRTQEKGHYEELLSLADCLTKGGPWPIPLDRQISSTRISLTVDTAIRASC